MLENLKILNIESVELFGKDGWASNPEDPSNEYLKIMNMGSISIKKHELEILNMSISIGNHEMGIWYRIQEQYL